jgi:ribosomal protein S27AE
VSTGAELYGGWKNRGTAKMAVRFVRPGMDFDLNNHMKPPRKCEKCGHSSAAHIDQLRCALCGCTPQREEFVQESFGFRSALPGRVMVNTRKR